MRARRSGAENDDHDDEGDGRRRRTAAAALTTTKAKHCVTCSCDGTVVVTTTTPDGDVVDGGEERSVARGPSPSESSSSSSLCGHALDDDEELPPPLPEPKYSVRRRVLPNAATALNSERGRRYLLEALGNRTAASYIPLSEHYVNQSDPAFCGVTTLLMVLNAFGVDPNIRWRGGWRYFGNEDTLLALCCLTKERVARIGITMEEFKRLATCQGLNVTMKRPPSNVASTSTSESGGTGGDSCSVEDFRNDVRNILCAADHVPIAKESDATEEKEPQTSLHGLIVVSFGRAGLGQTGEGHYSPLAAYHEDSDKVLVLDVARFKYQPYWVSVQDLYNAMALEDPVSHQPRGWYLLHPPCTDSKGACTKPKSHQHAHDSEDRRPAHVVPEVGEKRSPCPLHRVKVTYCKLSESEDK